VVYTPKDIRFTVNGDNLYATFLDWPGKKAVITTIKATDPASKEMEIPDWARGESSIPLTGTVWDLKGGEGDSAVYHYEFRTESDFFVSGGEAGEGVEGNYRQSGTDVYLNVGGFSWRGKYDGKKFETVEGGGGASYPGFYREEIKRITLLGDDKELEWVMMPDGLAIKTPEKQGKYAHVFKIERYHHPKLKE
jgi:hypothetical protein